MEREISLDVGQSKVDLYEATPQRFIVRGVTGKTPLRLPPDSAAVIVLTPSGKSLSRQSGKMLVDGVVVDHRAE